MSGSIFETSSTDYSRLADQLRSIADQIEQKSPGASSDTQDPFILRPHIYDTRALVDLARNVYQFRRSRRRTFDEELFGEPGWDILLDLYIADAEGKNLPVTSVCIGAAVPATTALRWIKLLENQRFVVREFDTSDARRTYIKLSDTGRRKMNELLSQFRKNLMNLIF